MNSSSQKSEQKQQSDQNQQQDQNSQSSNQQNSAKQHPSEGYHQAIQLMHSCCTQEGFLATTTRRDNYRRVWGRDSCIVGLAALMSNDPELIDGCRRSLRTLAKYQGPHGEIPSNVDAQTDRVSYGGTAGRIDADLWFVIACGAYWRFTGDHDFLEQMVEPLEKVRFLLGSWEFNNRGLLYVPPTGDWADEYLQSGYVLYDQLLYLQAQREFCMMHRQLHETADHDLQDRVARLKHLIRANYWFSSEDDTPDDVYHEVLFEKGRKAASNCRNRHWMSFFSPLGYGYRFDAMANSLVSLLEVADDDQNARLDRHIADNVVHSDVMLLPAFDPVITPKDESWDDLQMTFSHTFKNSPHEYHNGGLWPLVNGFYAASLAMRGQTELAQKYCDGIHSANSMSQDGQDWSFPEYVHGKTHQPGGTFPMSWSAASAVISECSLQGKRVFETDPAADVSD